jgi:hypothetical protein
VVKPEEGFDMRLSRFFLDFLGGQLFEGYTHSEECNGFACPYFTREQTERIGEAWRATGHNVRFDADNDQFIFELDAGDGEGYDTFPSLQDYENNLYPIGVFAGSGRK